MRVRVASGVAFFIVREARSSSFVVVRVACGCGVWREGDAERSGMHPRAVREV